MQHCLKKDKELRAWLHAWNNIKIFQISGEWFVGANIIDASNASSIWTYESLYNYFKYNRMEEIEPRNYEPFLSVYASLLEH